MTNLNILPNVLTAEECADVVARAEEKGFLSMAHRYPAGYRNNDRILLDDPALARTLEQRLAGQLSAERDGMRYVALNTRFRICRYRDGQKFSIHRDGSHTASESARTLTTVMIYLNEPPAFEGGSTRFYASSRHGQAPTHVIVPQRGAAAVFDHDLWHDGEAVTRGTKYVLRTDVIYASDRPAPRAHGGYVWCLSPGPDGTIASGSRDCQIRVWRDATLVTRLSGHTSSVAALAMHAGHLWSASRDGELRRWHGDASMRLRTEGPAILAMTSAPDGRLACATAAGEIELWTEHAMTGRARRHDDWVWSAQSDGDALVSCSEDGSLRCVSPTRSWRALTRSPLRALALTEDAIVAAGADGRLRRWTRDGRPLPDAGAHDAAVCALASDGPVVYGGDEEGHVYRFERGTRTLVRRHRDQVRALLVDGGRVVSASYDYGVAFGMQTSVSAAHALPVAL